MQNTNKKKSKKSLISLLVVISSTINTGVLMIVKLIYIASRQIGMASIMLGSMGIGIFFNSIFLILDIHSFINHFREKNLYKKCNYTNTLEAKRRNKHRVRSICLDILCDALFLVSAIASITLFSSPIALFVTVPLVTLGCVVMVGNI